MVRRVVSICASSPSSSWRPGLGLSLFLFPQFALQLNIYDSLVLMMFGCFYFSRTFYCSPCSLIEGQEIRTRRSTVFKAYAKFAFLFCFLMAVPASIRFTSKAICPFQPFLLCLFPEQQHCRVRGLPSAFRVPHHFATLPLYLTVRKSVVWCFSPFCLFRRALRGTTHFRAAPKRSQLFFHPYYLLSFIFFSFMEISSTHRLQGNRP